MRKYKLTKEESALVAEIDQMTEDEFRAWVRTPRPIDPRCNTARAIPDEQARHHHLRGNPSCPTHAARHPSSSSPETLHILYRQPQLGEVGWTIFKDDSHEAQLRDVAAGREEDSAAPGGYGWPVTAEYVYTPPGTKYDGREVIDVTVVYTPPLTERTLARIAHMEGSAMIHGEDSDPEHEAQDLRDFIAYLVKEAGDEKVMLALAEYWKGGRVDWHTGDEIDLDRWKEGT
jgi:hypothetical protein